MTKIVWMNFENSDSSKISRFLLIFSFVYSISVSLGFFESYPIPLASQRTQSVYFSASLFACTNFAECILGD